MDINTEVHNAFEVIKNGGIILYPTDTVWGIGCDASNEVSVSDLRALKRSAMKPFAVMAKNLESVQKE